MDESCVKKGWHGESSCSLKFWVCLGHSCLNSWWSIMGMEGGFRLVCQSWFCDSEAKRYFLAFVVWLGMASKCGPGARRPKCWSCLGDGCKLYRIYGQEAKLPIELHFYVCCSIPLLLPWKVFTLQYWMDLISLLFLIGDMTQTTTLPFDFSFAL